MPAPLTSILPVIWRAVVNRRNYQKNGPDGSLIEVSALFTRFPLDFPCGADTMNIVLNALAAYKSCNFSVRLQVAVGRSHATEFLVHLVKPVSPRQLEATIG